MAERDPGANEQLIERARAKAARCGTTLEAELVAWLERYTDGPEEAVGERRTDAAVPSRPHRPAQAPVPDRVDRRARQARALPPSAAEDGAGSRSLAYRRLLVSMRDVSPRPSRRRSESESEQ